MVTHAEGRLADAKFNIVAHSMGAYVTYKAMQAESFPAGRLNNVITLAGPLSAPPHYLAMNLQTVLNDITDNFSFTRYKNTAFFNFDGGLRDFHVTSLTTSFDKIIERKPKYKDNFFLLSTMQMKNLY